MPTTSELIEIEAEITYLTSVIAQAESNIAAYTAISEQATSDRDDAIAEREACLEILFGSGDPLVAGTGTSLDELLKMDITKAFSTICREHHPYTAQIVCPMLEKIKSQQQAETSTE